MNMEQIILKNIVKEYQVVHKEKGIAGAVKNLFHTEKTYLRAVDGVSFTIHKGEIVGYIGPNGAGKSTTIKMMCGIMMPTSGEITISGLSPQTERKKVVQKLGVVFGQRTQLNWDLRLGETFELLRRIYRVPEKEYLENVAELTQVLGLTEFMDKPVRQLSLGQRMRGEMAAAMLHSPEILFLDEPTIGLDIDAKKAVRDFILKINRERGVTVILTSHDLEDVSKLCDRLIVINHGVVVRDGKMDQIIRDMAPYRILKCETAEPVEKIRSSMVQLVSHEGNHMICRFDHHQHTASEVIGELVKEISILDLTVEEPNIEDAVMELYHA